MAKTTSAEKDALLLAYLQRTVTDLVTKAGAARLDLPGSEVALVREINGILTQFGLTIGQVLPQMLVEEYFGGVDEASADLIKNGDDLQPSLSLTPDGLIAQPFQKVIHLEALEEVIDDTMMDMTAAVAAAQASSVTTIAATLAAARSEIAQGFLTGDTRRQMQIRMMDALRNEGLTSFRTSDGKRLPLDFYAMTVARTKMRTAAVQGAVNRYEERGQDLVIIMGNGDSCATCSAFRGMVISTNGTTEGYPVAGTGGVRLPPYHPNCRCTVSVYMAKFKTPEQLEAIRKRNAEFDPEVDRRTPAQKAAYEHEQKLRRQANAEKKQFMRWQDELGAEAPASLGAFKRMKRQGTVQFQLLQSEYRSRKLTGHTRSAPTPPTPTFTVPAHLTATGSERLVTPEAYERFSQLTNTTAPPDMSKNPKRKKYAEELLTNAELGHMKVSVKKMRDAYGKVSYFEHDGKKETIEYSLKSDDPRGDDYKLQTLYHEFYHANYHLTENSSLGRRDWVEIEETATETAAQYMTKASGIDTSEMIPSYPKYMAKNLPRLKKLPEFQDAETLEDFGAVFMKYRFDPNFKTADWKNLHDQMEDLDRQQKHIPFEYNQKHYHDYIKNNMDNVVSQVMESIDPAMKNNPRYVSLFKDQIERGLERGGGTDGYDVAIGYAIRKMGVK